MMDETQLPGAEKYDRITSILQQQAAPFSQPLNNQQIDNTGLAAAYSAYSPKFRSFDESIADRNDQSMKAETGILDAYERKIAAGDKQATALGEKIKLFTGDDPDGNALFLQKLHDDPESIDPSNSFQVMTKLAQIAKQTGYRSPDTMLKRAQISKLGQTSSGGTKETIKAQEKLAGKQQLSAILSDISNSYDKLHDQGATVEADPKTPTDLLHNMGNYIAGTQGGSIFGIPIPGGQDVGKFFGTGNQSTRNDISAKVPLISAAIKNATGMSSQQMNSNFELQQYMKALSSPTNDRQANQKILRDLDALYGTNLLNKVGDVNTVDSPQTKTRRKYNPETGKIE